MAPRAAGAAAGLPAAPLGPTPAGAGCPPQAAAWPRRPEPIVFRAAGAAILKLFSGLSEEGGTPAGDLGVTGEEQGRRPIRTGRAAARGAGAGGRRRRGAPGRSLKELPSGTGLGRGTGEGGGRSRAERRPRGQALPGPRRRAGRLSQAAPTSSQVATPPQCQLFSSTPLPTSSLLIGRNVRGSWKRFPLTPFCITGTVNFHFYIKI